MKKTQHRQDLVGDLRESVPAPSDRTTQIAHGRIVATGQGNAKSAKKRGEASAKSASVKSSTAKPSPKGRLSATVVALLLACTGATAPAQQTTARLSALTPSVFRSQDGSGGYASTQTGVMQNGNAPTVVGQQSPGSAVQHAAHQELPVRGTIPGNGSLQPIAPNVARTGTATHRLSYLTGEQLTQELVTALGDQIQGSVQDHLVRIQLPGGTDLVIDRSTNTVQLSASPNAQPAASGTLSPAGSVAAWSQTLRRIDSVEARMGARHLLCLTPRQSAAMGATIASQGFRNRSSASTFQVRVNSTAAGSASTVSANRVSPLGATVSQVSAIADADALSQASLAGWQPEVQDELEIVGQEPESGAPEGSTQGQDETQGGQGGQGGQDGGVVQGTVKPSESMTIRYDEQSNTLIVDGTEQDVERIRKIIAQLGERAAANKPVTEITNLVNANSQNLAPVVQELYTAVYEARLGPASVTAIPQPNSILVSGSKSAVVELKNIIATLDVETPARGNFRVFRVQHMSASNAANRLAAFFGSSVTGVQQGFAGANAAEAQPVGIIPDPRSNSIIMKAGAGELAQAEELLREIDIADGEDLASQQVEIVQLRNSVATDMAQVIQQAVNGQVPGAPQVQAAGGNAFGGGGGGFGQANQVNQDPSIGSTGLRLKLMTIDKETGVVRSGILFDVKIVADASSNSLIVTAAAESMPLVLALIQQLDRLPAAVTDLKVFTIENADAAELFELLNTFFGQNQQQQGGGGFGQQANTGLDRLPLQSGARDQTLVNLRFALDARTNSIIASGSQGDLQVVEDLLLVLDRRNASRFITKNVRLSNLPADEMAAAIQAWQQSRADLASADPATLGANVNIRQQIVVTPEPISNSVIITSTPENVEEVLALIRTLDRRPPMVAIEVMIAEVTLSDTQEFGLEFGVQDSILFDRGVAQGIGFPFNQAGIGNSLDARGLATREDLAGQGLVNLGVGRTNSALGYGGLVLSAGNESINLLLRALKDRQEIRVLSKPQLMTIDNLQSRVQVGQQVPYVTGSNQNAFGGFNNTITLIDVGVILEVVPRVSPDGMITMLVNTTNSSVGSEANGSPIAVDANGNTIRQAPINIIESITTTLSRSGQTVVLSGLLRETKTYAKRGIPYLSDLPRLGPLFSFQSETANRSELLIFLTPTLIESGAETSMYNETAFSRMNWCLEDVINLNGPIGHGDPGSFYDNSGPVVVYPDVDPTGFGLPAVLVGPDAGYIPGNVYNGGFAPGNVMPSNAMPGSVAPEGVIYESESVPQLAPTGVPATLESTSTGRGTGIMGGTGSKPTASSAGNVPAEPASSRIFPRPFQRGKDSATK